MTMTARNPSDVTAITVDTEPTNRGSVDRSLSTQKIMEDAPDPRQALQRRESLPLNAGLATGRDPVEYEKSDPMLPKGWRPYFCLLASFFLMFNSWGMVNAYGTFATYYNQQLMPEKDIMMLSLIGSTQCFCVLLLSLPVGRLLDAGKHRHLIVLGTVLLATGLFSLSGVNGKAGKGDGNYPLIWFTQAFITGLGMACFFVTSSQVTATWFVASKSLAIGIVASGAAVAGVVYPSMLRFLATTLGFNNAVRCVAGVAVATSAFSIAFANPNPKHKVRQPPAGWGSFRTWVDKDAFKNSGFCWLTAAIASLFLGFYCIFFTLEEWAASSGVGFRQSADGSTPFRLEGALATWALLAIMNGSSTLGRISAGYISDHFGALRVHMVVTIICALLTLILWTLSTTAAAAIGFVVVFGAFSGAVIGLPPASMADILDKRDMNEQAKLGHWVGMMYSFAAIPALIGPVISGHLITKFNNNFITVQMWSGWCMIVSAACMTMAYREKTKRLQQKQRNKDAGTIEFSHATTQTSCAESQIEKIEKTEGV